MKILESKIFDIFNNILSLLQTRLSVIRNSSLILTNIDFFIFLFIILTFIVSTFASTNMMGLVSFFVPVLVTLKVLITKDEKIELEKCNFFLLIYLVICLITNFTSSLPCQSLYGFSKTLLYFGFYFAVCQFLKNNKKYILPLIASITVIMTAECFIGILQSIIKVESIATWQDLSYVNPEDVISRVYGTLKPYNPNLFGGFIIAGFATLPALCALFLAKKKFKSAVIAALCTFLYIFCIFMTGCRGAYIALFVSVIGIILASYHIIFKCFCNEKLKNIWKILVSSIAVFGTAFISLHRGILSRLMSIFILRGDSSTSFRFNVYQSAWQMFQDNPICGIGVGNKVFREIYGLYMRSGFDALSCYSIYLEMAVESGIFALIAYLLFVITILAAGIKHFLSETDFQTKVLIFTACISIIAVMVHGIVDTVYFRPPIQYIFWTMVAVLVTLTRKEETAE